MAAARCEVYLAGLELLQPGHGDLLDERERERAARFRRQPDRDRFVLATALLRAAAGRRLGCDPVVVELDRRCDHCGRQHGRPRLPGTGLQASISHSAELVAVALTGESAVGIDVEAMRARDYEPLLPSVCSPDERHQVRSASDFYAYWSRKEAFLKATGEGLRTPMTSLTVTGPASPPGLLTVRGGPAPPCGMADLPVPAGYAGAVAVLTAGEVAFEVLDSSQLLALRP